MNGLFGQINNQQASMQPADKARMLQWLMQNRPDLFARMQQMRNPASSFKPQLMPQDIQSLQRAMQFAKPTTQPFASFTEADKAAQAWGTMQPAVANQPTEFPANFTPFNVTQAYQNMGQQQPMATVPPMDQQEQTNQFITGLFS